MPITKKVKDAKIDQRQFIFTAEIIEDIMQKTSMGFQLPRHMNPWFMNQTAVRKRGCVYGWSDFELEEFAKCKMDIHYFANNYCKIKIEDGSIKQMKLRNYQYKVLDVYSKNRFVINMSSRQSGKTITAAITLLHYCIFNSNKGIMMVANKGETVTEIIDKIKNIYKLLPFFMKPGIVNWNTKAIVFDNGCRIKSQARSKEPAIGFTIDFLYVDEFAHIPASIARHYYKSVVPTVSSINNSKILITSTPNGTNLFKELVEGAEVPEGHPNKNQYKCIRVYWYEVAGRLDPKFYPMDMEMRKRKITFDEIISDLKNQGFKATIEKEQSDTGDVKVIRIDYEDGKWPLEVVREVKIKGVNFAQYGTITNWKETETKLIGGEEAFNQEYNIQFISGSKRILNAKTAIRLEQRKIKYTWENIEVLNKLRFPYEELLWRPDFVHSTRAKEYWVGKIDTSEGLGQDYSVLNLFTLQLRSNEWLKNNKIKNMYEAFYLKQTGIYINNRLHPTELADLVYLLFFEYFDPERCKIVLELNGPGGRLLDALPKTLDQNNDFGEYIFVRYKHNLNNEFKRPGLKVSGGNKKDMVKTYIDSVESDKLYVDEYNTYLEMENFIKVETKSGNVTYQADSGHDDIVMTLVNGSTIFETREWENMCSSKYMELEKIDQIRIDEALDLNYNPEAKGYKSLSGALKSSRSGITKGRYKRKFRGI